MNRLILPLTLLFGITGLLAVGLALGDHDDDDDDDGRRSKSNPAAALADPGYALYANECGGCHLAYPPALLPAASWEAMMGGLSDHFGDNAELDADTAATIRDFLARNAAAPGAGKHAERTWRATRGLEPPLRITATDYFRGQHHEIPAKMISDNPEVRSFSQCAACHQGAERGDFDDDRVHIPGYGRWDD